MRGRPEDETHQSIFSEDKCMYWQLLIFLVCIGMYRNSCFGMYLYVLAWYVLWYLLLCIVFGLSCKYWYVLVCTDI